MSKKERGSVKQLDKGDLEALSQIGFQVRNDRVNHHQRRKIEDVEKHLRFLRKAEAFEGGVLFRKHALDMAAALVRLAVEGSTTSAFKGPDVPPYNDAKMDGG